jgi:hypothetical protein
MHITPGKRTSMSFLGSRDKTKDINTTSSNAPTLGRPRGKTVPRTGVDLRTRTPDQDTDKASILSMTPSTGGKHLANWLSGLLGR